MATSDVSSELAPARARIVGVKPKMICDMARLTLMYSFVFSNRHLTTGRVNWVKPPPPSSQGIVTFCSAP
jgi:hypothetical protein